MAVYVFNLLVGYVDGGVDHAQGYRASLLKDFSHPVKFIFTNVPRSRDINLYKRLGISGKQMLSMHQYFSDNHTLEATENADDKAAELKDRLYCSDISYVDEEIKLIKDGYVVAAILLEKTNPNKFFAINYFCQRKLIRTEFYTKGISYANYYVTSELDSGLYVKLVRRTFYNKNGSVAYDQIWKEDEERYIFPDGRICTKLQLWAEFLKKLNLSEKDIIFLDYGTEYESFVQPLFQFGGKARIMMFFHSSHYFEKWEDPEHFLHFNQFYLYYLKYSNQIDTMVVSTQGQKDELIEKLKEYNCSVPNVEVIPVSGLDQLRYPKQERKQHSLITVSRIHPRKKIDWIIRSVIKAHEKNPDIFIDIYGNGMLNYYQYLQDMVSANDAQSYVRFMGYKDVTEVYKDYEVYISASLWETFGLSLMEAVGSGTAMIGLDVKYGNRLFIQPEKNGYLIDYDRKYAEDDDSKLIDDMAEKIVEIFADEERLEKFHRASYEIAEGFSTKLIEKKWKELLG